MRKHIDHSHAQMHTHLYMDTHIGRHLGVKCLDQGFTFQLQDDNFTKHVHESGG